MFLVKESQYAFYFILNIFKVFSIVEDLMILNRLISRQGLVNFHFYTYNKTIEEGRVIFAN